jgi:hypothetical protein
VARTEVIVLCGVMLSAALLCGGKAGAQEPPPAGAPALAPAPEATAPAVCPAATSLKQCTAACQAQFPPKPKVELPEDLAARARLAIHGWWALGAGAALLVAGGITGGVTLHLDNELSKECPGGSCPLSRHADLDRRDRLAVTSTVLVAGGVAASAVGILILAVFARTPKMSEDESGEEPAAAFVPALGPNAAGAAMAWRF